jgi:hypothetical protein
LRLFRLLRILRAFRSLRDFASHVFRHRVQSAFGSVAIIAVLMVIFSSIAILQVENKPESNIKTAGDALWWSYVTITTVGYGDKYPVTTEGRVIAAVLMTVGVYGLVAGIVKLDDIGAWLSRRAGAARGGAAALQRGLGTGIVRAAPWLMKLLSVAGTIAMFLVGGGILSHGIPGMHDIVHHTAESAANLPAIGSALATVLPTLVDLLVGIVAGSLILAVVSAVKRLRGGAQAASH